MTEKQSEEPMKLRSLNSPEMLGSIADNTKIPTTSSRAYARAVSSGKVDGMMNGHKRYMMNERQPTVNACRYKTTLQELDNDAVSVGRNLLGDDISLSSRSNASRDSPAMFTHIQLIDNMHELYRPSEALSTTESSRVDCGSRRTRRSRSSRRQRGLSLERAISKTILESAAWADANFGSSEEAGKSSEVVSNCEPSTAEFILQDLDRAHSVIQYEIASERSQCSDWVVHEQYDHKSGQLLPPMLSDSVESDLILFGKGKGDSGLLLTPDTSDETEEGTETKPASSSPSPGPFMNLVVDSFPTVSWSNSSRESSRKPREVAASAEVPSGWTSFEDNPFVVTWPDACSVEENFGVGSVRNNFQTNLDETSSFVTRISI